MKISIATKISLIFTAIILAMASAACLNLYATREVESNLDRITNNYLVAYGASARMNIRTLEQAYRVRRYVIEKTFSIKSADSDLASTRARIALLSTQFHAELGHARAVVDSELADSGALADRALLGRIDERLARIESEQQRYEKNLNTALSNFEIGDMPTFKLQFAALTVWRMDFDDYVEGTRMMMLSAAQEAGRQAKANQLRATFYGWTLLALSAILAIWVSVRLTRQLVRPIGKLLEGTRAIASGRLDLELPVTSSDEIGVLTAAFNRMTEDLRAGTRAREMFGKYVDTRVAKNLIEHPYLLGQEGERRVMTVLFCDLAGFTSMSETMTPRGLVTVVNRYFTLMSEAVRERDGVIDKFIGDAVMAYWGPPFGS
jgi:nitrogen fixation/metabolism regulation signal transduction histidine kinase